MCSVFRHCSDELCHTLAMFAHGLCTDVVNPSSLSTFLSFRLTALNKNANVRQISVCKTLKRTVTKAALMILRQDIIDVVSGCQHCAGHCAGIEAAVHLVKSVLLNESAAGALQVDSSNVFNSLRRATARYS